MSKGGSLWSISLVNERWENLIVWTGDWIPLKEKQEGVVRGEIHTWFQPQELQVGCVISLKDCDFPRTPACTPGGLLHSAELPGSYFCNKLCLHRFNLYLTAFHCAVWLLQCYFKGVLQLVYSFHQISPSAPYLPVLASCSPGLPPSLALPSLLFASPSFPMSSLIQQVPLGKSCSPRIITFYLPLSSNIASTFNTYHSCFHSLVKLQLLPCAISQLWFWSIQFLPQNQCMY